MTPRGKYNRQRRPAGEVSFNVTPLIDCTFLMILFVILGGQMASSSPLPKVELPRPYASQAAQDKSAMQPDKMVISILSAQADPNASADDIGQASGYRVDKQTIAPNDNETLLNLFKARKAVAGGEELFIEIRADRRVQFGQIQPVLAAAAEAGIDRANITAMLEKTP